MTSSVQQKFSLAQRLQPITIELRKIWRRQIETFFLVCWEIKHITAWIKPKNNDIILKYVDKNT